MKTLHDIKKLLKLGDHHNYADIFSRVGGLTKERDDLSEYADAMRKERDEAQSQISEITKLLVEADLMRRNINSSVDVLIKERGVVQGTINGLKQLLELPEAAGLTELFNAVEALELNKSQLAEIRYVLHGDIQPCTVLYSDDTTTLLRLDEGDMMLETDTIEWSDSVTYRCQELLRGAMSGSARAAVARHLAQLVRDERILLNDNALETSGTVDLKVDSDIGVVQGVSVVSCASCPNVYHSSLDLCPQCHTTKQGH